MLCRKVMLEVGWLLEGSSLHPFAPQNALVEASPCSKLSPDTAVTTVGTRVLAIHSATHRRQLEPVVELTAFEGLFLLEKPVRCQPRAGIWVPNIPWGREHHPVSPTWEGGECRPCKPKQDQIQHLLSIGQLCPSSPTGNCWEPRSDSTAVTVTCSTSRVPVPPLHTHFSPSFAVGW